jgi:uncharacterized protein (TIGR02145 family)
MVAAELTDNAGQPLQLGVGQTATVRFPIATQQMAAAPASIDLWSFDEQNGYWMHDGVATKQGSEYVAQVSHFSFWNCDIPGSWITLQGTVTDTTGQPIAGATVTLNSQTNGTASDYTNAQGQFSGWVPAGQTLILSIQVPCNGANATVLTQSIGPFGVNTTLNPISVSIPGAIQITGTLVDCNNNALSSGYIIANGLVYFANTAGQFSFSVCGSNIILYPFGSNPIIAGAPAQVPGNGNMGNVQVCGVGGGANTVTDIDGNTYTTVQIGTQEWMQENLKVTRYKNGDVIPTGLNNIQWQNTSTGAWAYYNDSIQYSNLYGKLYNWYSVVDSRGLCPTGWHVPTDIDWNHLVKFLDPLADTTINSVIQSQIAGGFMKSVGDLQWGNGLWLSPNTGANNSSGFSGLPGGLRNYVGNYEDMNSYGFWWSASDFGAGAGNAWYRALYFGDAQIGHFNSNKLYGFSVRCVKD